MRILVSSGFGRRSAQALGVLAAALVLSAPLSEPARAQSFLQQLFGIGPQPQAQPMPRVVSPRRANDFDAVPRSIRSEPTISSRDGSRSVPKEGTGSYTTVCVRLCDGFYFPISHRASRGRFQHDAETCRSRCGETEARLFYYSSSDGGMTNAIDLNGRSYSRLQNAFLHRKQLVAGCACKPQPWSEASLARHQLYAMAEGRSFAGGGGIGTVDVVAGAYPSGPLAGSAAQSSGGGTVEAETVAAAGSAAPNEDATGQHADAAPTVAGVVSGAGKLASLTAAPEHNAAPSSTARSGKTSQRRKPRIEVVSYIEAPRRAKPAPTAVQQRERFVAASPRKPPVRIASAPPAGASLLGGGSMRWPGDPAR